MNIGRPFWMRRQRKRAKEEDRGLPCDFTDNVGGGVGSGRWDACCRSSRQLALRGVKLVKTLRPV